MNICPPDDPNLLKVNLGEIITGAKTFSTNYIININQDSYCKVLCKKKISKTHFNNLKWLISKEYTMNLYLDYLPAAESLTLNPNDPTPQKQIKYNGGIPIGFTTKINNEEILFIYNHYRMFIYLHQIENKYQIVGYEIEPFSINQTNIDIPICGNNTNPQSIQNLANAEKQKLLVNEEIYFTYDTIFLLSPTPFNLRFSPYEHINQTVHWLSIINSNIIIFVLTFITIIILIRSIKKDIEIYNTRVSEDEIIDEYGWKQVANDVFRKPPHPEYLSALIGTGIQILIMLFYTLIFASFGFFHQEVRGSLLTMMIIVFIFLSIVSGYCSSRIFKSFHGRNWVRTAILTSLLFPLFCFILLMIVNWLYRLEGSNVVMQFKQITAIVVLWIFCSSPLVIIGAFVGAKQMTIEMPGKINVVPSQIPNNKQWYFRFKYACWFIGLVPFAAVFIEFIYIMTSIWKHEIFFLARFVLLALIIMVVISTEMGLIFVYVNLCKGDYNWWWKCFGASSAHAIYIFGYSVYYFFTLNITRASTIVIYWGLMSLITFIVVIMCGSIGVIVTFLFLRTIYGMIKVD